MTPSYPKSSHMVPKRLTPAIFRLIGSSMRLIASMVCWKACFAVSPPCPNAIAILLASNPIALKPSWVVLLPSIERIENSLIVSPSLSTEKVPLCAPLINILNISVLSNPSFLNCTEYSFMVSKRSPFLSSPACAPWTIKSNACAPDTPNCFSIISAVLMLSVTSYPNVSLSSIPALVICSKPVPVRPVIW